MEKKYVYLPIFIEGERIATEYNKECSCTAYQSEKEAWKSFIADCETDDDIAYILAAVGSGNYSVKRIEIQEADND